MSPSDAQHTIGSKRKWIEEVVVDPPIDHVDSLQTARSAPEDLAAIEHHVATFNQIDTHCRARKLCS